MRRRFMPHLLLLIPYSFYARAAVRRHSAALTYRPRSALISARADAERVAQSALPDIDLSSGAWTPLLLAISLFSGAIAAMVDGTY